MTEASKPVIDYVSMEGGDMLQAVGDDAMKWAEAFCQIKAAKAWTVEDIDESLMVAWFANAIESSHDIRRHRSERAAKGQTSIVVPPLHQ